MIFPNWPIFEDDEINAVKKVLESGKVNYLTGNLGRKFEEEFADYTDCKFAIAVANGSLALTAAYMSLNLPKGSEIITSPRTFIATSSTAVLLNLKTIFADVDYDSGNITAKSIEKLITEKTKAIAVVHIAGWPADMNSICNLAKKYNLKILEDCSQAHGAKINGKSVGSFGDVATWSFCQDKIISTGGEGGMITTNSKEIFVYISAIKNHGKTKEAFLRNKNKIGFKWLHDHMGNNYRLTEMQSQIGLIQLKKIKEWSKLRRRNAQILIDTLKTLEIVRIPLPQEDIQHAYYKFYFFLKPNHNCLNMRDSIISDINSKGFPAFHGGCSEIYLEKAFINLDLKPKERLTNAKELGESSIMLLVHPTIDSDLMLIYASEVKKSICKFL